MNIITSTGLHYRVDKELCSEGGLNSYTGYTEK